MPPTLLLIDRLGRFSQLAHYAATHSPSSPPYREVWSIAQSSARMRLFALPLFQFLPTPSLHQCRLCRRVRSLQAVSEGCVLGVGEPVDSVCLQRRELPYQRRENAGCVPGYVLRVLRTPLRQPNHLPEIR